MAIQRSTLSPLSDQGTPLGNGSFYDSLSVWEAAAETANPDITAAGDTIELECYDFGSGGQIDAVAALIDIPNTSFDNNITIYAAPSNEYNYQLDLGFKYVNQDAANQGLTTASKTYIAFIDVGIFSSANRGAFLSNGVSPVTSDIQISFDRCTVGAPITTAARTVFTIDRYTTLRFDSSIVVATTGGSSRGFDHDVRNTDTTNFILRNSMFYAQQPFAFTDDIGTFTMQNCTGISNDGTPVWRYDPTTWYSGGVLEDNAVSDAVDFGTGTQLNVSLLAGVDYIDLPNDDFNPEPTGKLDGTGTSPPVVSLDIVKYPFSDPSDIGPYQIQGGVTAPVLDTDTTTAITQTTATIGCTTDTAGGTLFWMVSTNPTETDVAIKAGGGADSGNLVPVLGVNGGISVTGLVADTDYYNHWVQEGP
jgi:hypothetical protein